MVSSWMPDVQVDIAFTSTWSTPAASRTWTDVSSYVELADKISIAFGRQDERATADANQLTLTLDNSDGRFTAGRAASPYSPNVKLGRPIRVRVTPPGGTTVTRFVGFIDEWPVEWDGSDAYAKATIRATSRMSRLGLTAKMRSMIEATILADSPIAYWTLGDPTGSKVASESSARSEFGTLSEVSPDFSSSQSAVFGNAIGSPNDELTAMTLLSTIPPYEAYSNGSTVKSVRVCFITDPGTPLLPVPLLNIYGATSPAALLSIRIGGSGLGYAIQVTDGVSLNVSGGTATPGVLHDLIVTITSGGMQIYLDGVIVASGSGLDYTSMTRLRMPATTVNMTATTVCHLALYDTVLTPAQVAAQAQAVLTYLIERTDQRLVRILSWAGIPSSEITTDTGAESMIYQKTSGQSFLDALRDVESTENGVLYDRPDGNVGFRGRSARYLATPAATLNMASQHVGSDFRPKLDRSALVNDVTVSSPTTNVSARATNTASVDEYGAVTGSAAVVAVTYDTLQQRANWMVASYSTPRTRVPSLTVDVVAHQGLTPTAQTLLGIGVGDLLAVTNAPTQADTTNQQYFVEGYTESIGPESYDITYNLSPAFPALNTFVLNDAIRGVLDSSYVLAL